MTTTDTYRIKPLAWEPVCFNVYAAAAPFFGTLTVTNEASHLGEWRFYHGGMCVEDCFETLEAAQLAAESWYRERLAAALEKVT